MSLLDVILRRSDLLNNANLTFKAAFAGANIAPGDKLPPFTMRDATSKEVTSDSLLAKGPLLLSFYRGEWCPFCNFELVALQKHLADFQAKGVTLVAISPELPSTSLSTTEKHALKFPMLTDEACAFAKKLGIVVTQPDDMKPFFKGRGVDFKERTGREEMEVPVPATILVDRDGIVRQIHADWDYTQRLEPATALEWVGKL